MHEPRENAMKVRSRLACLSAAVAAAALMWGGVAQARDLTWDANADADPRGADGPGNWDETSLNWIDGDLVTGTNVDWDSTIPDSATFGNATSGTVAGVGPHNISFAAPITVQNLSIGTGADGGAYRFNDFAGGSLTIAGNVSKV